MPPPSHPASSFVIQQKLVPPGPTKFFYKPPKIRHGAFRNSGLGEDSCKPWLETPFPGARRPMELCSGLIYDKEGWKTTWINKIGLMQPSEAYGEDALGGIFRERPYQLGGNNTTYGRIWLWGTVF